MLTQLEHVTVVVRLHGRDYPTATRWLALTYIAVARLLPKHRFISRLVMVVLLVMMMPWEVLKLRVQRDRILGGLARVEARFPSRRGEKEAQVVFHVVVHRGGIEE